MLKNSNNTHLLNVVIQLTRIANTLEEQNKIAKLKINLSEVEFNSIDEKEIKVGSRNNAPLVNPKSVSYGGTNGDNN